MSGESTPTPKTPLTGLAYWAAALFLVVTWGSAFNFIEVALEHMSPNYLVVFRLIIGVILLLGFAILTGRKFPPIKDRRWLWYLFLGLTGMTLPFFLTATGQEEIDSGLSAIIISVMPLMTLILAHFAKTDRMTLRKLIGFTIGLIGTILLFLPQDFAPKLVEQWKPQTMVLGAALFYAITTVTAKKAPETDPVIGAVMMTFWAAVSATIYGLSVEPFPLDIGFYGWLAVFGLGLGSSGFATIVYLSVIDRNGPTELAKINYFPAFVAVFLGVVWLDEEFSGRQALALGIIILGVWIARNRPKPNPSSP